MRSACPLTYSSSKARLQIPSASHWPGLLPLASCPRRAQPSAAGQGTKPPGASEGLAGTLGRFLPPSSPPGGPRHTLRRERERERSQTGAAGRGGGREREPLVPHDRMQGGGDGSALGFCEGKALYPPVLTPRSTARLREGKM